MIHQSVINLSQAELKQRVSEYYAFERIADIEEMKQSILSAHKRNQSETWYYRDNNYPPDERCRRNLQQSRHP